MKNDTRNGRLNTFVSEAEKHRIIGERILTNPKCNNG